MRKHPIVTGEIYHVMNKSIAGFEIFHQPQDFDYMLRAFRYFTLPNPPDKYSHFLKRDPVVVEKGFEKAFQALAVNQSCQVRIIAFCLMPTHFHLLLQQETENGLSEFLRKSLNAYARYFNVKHERKGPLWVGPFKNVPIENDEQLLHVTRYIHLNPVTAGLVQKPEDWPYSSYQEYVVRDLVDYPVTNHEGLIDMGKEEYAHFCHDQVDYQKELAQIKNEALE